VEQSGLDEWRLSVGTEIKGQIRRLTQKQRETTRVDREEKEEQKISFEVDLNTAMIYYVSFLQQCLNLKRTK